MTDFARDLPPCRLCELDTPHLWRAGLPVWDLHELPVHDGRVFQECTTPNEAKKRYEGGRAFRPRHRKTCEVCGAALNDVQILVQGHTFCMTHYLAWRGLGEIAAYARGGGAEPA